MFYTWPCTGPPVPALHQSLAHSRCTHIFNIHATHRKHPNLTHLVWEMDSKSIHQGRLMLDIRNYTHYSLHFYSLHSCPSEPDPVKLGFPRESGHPLPLGPNPHIGENTTPPERQYYITTTKYIIKLIINFRLKLIKTVTDVFFKKTP